MKNRLAFVLVLILGIVAYLVGSQASAIYVNSMIGGNVTSEGFAVTTCPPADQQLVKEYEDETRTELVNDIACLGNECLVAFDSVSSLTSTCAGSPGALTENCDPSTVTGQNVNAQRFEGNARTFADMSTSNSAFGAQCSNWLGPGATNPVTASCVIGGTVASSEDYGSGIFYVADIMHGTFGPKAISFCGIPVGKTVDSDNCTQHVGANNHVYSAIAIDSSTDRVFVNHGQFNQELTRWDVNSSTGAVPASTSLETGAAALDHREVNNADTLKAMTLIPGGNLFILRRDVAAAPDVTRVIVWPQDLTAEIDDYIIDVGTTGNATTIVYSPRESAFYACGVASGAVNTVVKFNAAGTELASNTATNVDACYDIVINEVTGRLYVSTNAFLNEPLVVELDMGTLAIVRSVQLIPSNTGTVGHNLSIDPVGEKIYAASKLGATSGHIIRIDTCSSI